MSEKRDPLEYVLNRLEAERDKKPPTVGYPPARKELLDGIVALRSENAALSAALRHAARELQMIADDDPCDKLHQTGEGKACVALAEKLLGPMREWPEEPNALPPQSLIPLDEEEREAHIDEISTRETLNDD